MNVQTTTTITLTPEEVKGAIIESLMRLGYSASPDQVVLQCRSENPPGDWEARYPTVPTFWQALVNDPEPIKK